jgi:hypothetical protein
MIIDITSLSQLPEWFRLFTGTIEQALKLHPTARIYRYTGKYAIRSGCWNLIAIEATDEMVKAT